MLTVIFRRVGLQDGYDETRPADYTADPVMVPAASARTKPSAVPLSPMTARTHRRPGDPF